MPRARASSPERDWPSPVRPVDAPGAAEVTAWGKAGRWEIRDLAVLPVCCYTRDLFQILNPRP